VLGCWNILFVVSEAEAFFPDDFSITRNGYGQ
jgi:hypothetical protein